MIDKIRELLAPFRAHILRTAKAYSASAVVALLAFLNSRGVEVPEDVSEPVGVLVAGLVAWAVTWLIPNKQ